MKHIFTLFLVSGIIFLASCGNGGNDNKIAVTPTYDSLSKGGFVALNFTNDSGRSESFYINDLVKNNWPVYSLYGSVVYNHVDSLWHCRVQLADQHMQQLGIIFNGTNVADTGNFTVTGNSCTVIDYSTGGNITYAIAIGSYINITQSTYPIQGNFNLTLYKNHFTTYASGNFKIFY